MVPCVVRHEVCWGESLLVVWFIHLGRIIWIYQSVRHVAKILQNFSLTEVFANESDILLSD